jgi:anti-sigma factor RsiW
MAMTGASDAPATMTEHDESPTREQRLLARREREIEARASLQPLGPHERPTALRVAVVVAIALALGVCVSVATVHNLSRHGGSLPGGLFLAGVLLLLAWGMYERRYWAVLGFQALLAFQIIVTSLALIVAETLLAAGLCALSIGLAGWLFWKLVRVMGRIQAGDRESGAGEA